MRTLFSLRTLIGIGAVVAFAVVALTLFLLTSGGSGSTSSNTRNIEMIAVVSGIQADEGWSTNSGATTGAATVSLDDGRIVSIPAGTLGEITCSDLSTPQSCVMLADTLGSAVVWFTLVPADPSRAGRYLNLPGLVDMREGGDYGVLANGWVIRLATPTERNCENDPGNLRDFIDSFGGDGSETVLDLLDDQIVEVICN
jgi:hypothetical protein